ncbi:MAG TPA: sodium:proton exchanger [Actinomycetota bacterium]|nr:sodium:proton exchanger [Actinomycetota bacterium]
MTEALEERRPAEPARPAQPVPARPAKAAAAIALAVLATVPGVSLRLTGTHLPPPLAALLLGMAVVGAAFLLSWAAEAVQLDISSGLAIGLLALIAVLPEYAVDFVFAWKGGTSVRRFGASCPPLDVGAESPCSLALANMTGSNRLLIGVGWSLVVFVAWYRHWRARRPQVGVVLGREHSVELAYLALATAYSLSLPLKGTVTLVDALVLVGIFAAYTWRIARGPVEEPHLVGPAAALGALATARRRAAVTAIFVVAAGVIVLVAEPFADALVATGAELGVSEFLLVQWLAPLASEAPELLVALVFAWRLNTDAALGTLLSSQVNQWTLLVGTLPVVFAVASATAHGLPIDVSQREELLLTAGQSFFAVAVLANLRISNLEAVTLFGLFWAQFVLGALVPASVHGLERLVVSALYLVLGTAILLRDRARLPLLLRQGLLLSPADLQGAGRAQGEGMGEPSSARGRA